MRPEGIRNPYAPPRAPVADPPQTDPPQTDPPQTDPPGKRPIPVALAVGALGLYVLMSVLNVALRGPPAFGRPVTPMARWATDVLFVSGALWVVYQVALGKHWARVIALFCAITEVVFLLRASPPLWAAPSVRRVLDFESVPVVVAVCLLFLTSGRRWFRRWHA